MDRPELTLTLRPEQRMLLLPRMLQALDLLRVPREALDEMVESAVAENEALAYVRRRRSRDASDDILRSAPARTRPLLAHLEPQLAGVEGSGRVLDLLRFLIESLDAAGFRTVSDAELARAVEPAASPEEIAACEAALATLDPPGVGARGPVEAMLRQLRVDDPDRPVLERLLREHLENLAGRRKPLVARALDLSLEELDDLLLKASRLRRRPAEGFEEEPVVVVRPDLVVRRTERGFEIELRGGESAELRLNPRVVARARDRATPRELRAKLRERIEGARAFLSSLAQRRATLDRVARAVFVRQPAFLEHGPRFLRPLRMQGLADALSIHASTVSRAVAGKYVETEWGILRMRDFFGTPVVTTVGETDTRENLREAVRGVFAEEDRSRPLGDVEVVERLRARGYLLARRTVAKYRAELGIPPSWRRREDALHA